MRLSGKYVPKHMKDVKGVFKKEDCMSQIYKCDACGETFEYEKHCAVKFGIIKDQFDVSGRQNMEWKDLCDSCYCKLNSFFDRSEPSEKLMDPIKVKEVLRR